MGSNGFKFYCILFYVYRKLQIFPAISRLQKENLSRIFVLHSRQLTTKTSPPVSAQCFFAYAHKLCAQRRFILLIDGRHLLLVRRL